MTRKRKALAGSLTLAVVGLALSLSRTVAADGSVPANGLVVLLTDYGSADGYPGILKGVVMSANPNARLFDATHDVPSFDVAQASFLLAQVAPDWPAGTTFVVVVDPGVGSARERIALRTWPDGKLYVGPNNGVFTDIAARSERCEARLLTNEQYRRPGVVSSTFHGRDWFGPVGGHLSAGVPFESLGEPTALVTLNRPAPRQQGGQVSGTVLYADHYGNLLTNIPHALLVQAGLQVGQALEVSVANGTWVPLPWVDTYSSVARGKLLLTTHNALRGVEIAVNYGSARERLKAKAGQTLRLRAAGGR
ncbi:MAG: SAM-dependent chlorinase/fluorinase [Armatimonadetes bacterium]|nr:SAM-dependent chlorinase/fluorinase [Armatimonadota bacterium]